MKMSPTQPEPGNLQDLIHHFNRQMLYWLGCLQFQPQVLLPKYASSHEQCLKVTDILHHTIISLL